MKRFPAYDPPEYIDWTPDPKAVAHFRETIVRSEDRANIVAGLDSTIKLDLYRGLVRARLHDVMLKRWVKQGVISKAWLATGEEATTIGPVHALDRSKDYVAPMIRNAGACCEMGLPVADMLRGYLGTDDAPAKGRDGHVGSFAHRVLEPISNIGNIPPVTNGLALAFRFAGSDAVAMTWVGDGSMKNGASHEAFNFAATQKLPVIFIIQNNQVALGTRTEVSHLPGNFDDYHSAYGVSGWSFDGNNVLDAYAAAKLAAQQCREGNGPVMLSATTFRMGGHATHDEQEARQVIPPEVFSEWGKRDPIGLYEEWLVEEGIERGELERIETDVSLEIDEAAAAALESKKTNMPLPDSALKGVYAD
ncbi:MAG: thiamine pyrophosphate-dependent dehydrogenase E1 component subunit alpha [Gemmatimonadota bacterium]|nr:thiamine pyrophosphate-dependent dehydrogenase E1 component subunit alpha [Gemmatimonadota bacterium]